MTHIATLTDDVETFELVVVPPPPKPDRPHPDGILIPDAPPRTKGMSDSEFKEWREAGKQAAADRLLLALTNLCDDDIFRRFCQQARTFHTYSWLNQILIWMQFPTYERVASIWTWNKLKRKVKAGSVSIKIWYPYKKKYPRRDPDTHEIILGPNGQPEMIDVTVGFNIGRVFDISQTEGEPLVELPMPTDYHGEDKLSRMAIMHISNRIVAGNVGYRIADLGYDGDVSKAAKGYYRRLGPEEIVISQGLDSISHLAVLIHETAHMLVTNRNRWDNVDMSYAHGELLAEGTAAIVMAALGYSIDNFAVPYLGYWLAAGGSDINNPTEEAIATTRLVMYEMMNVADTILDWLRPLTQDTAIAQKMQESEARNATAA